MKLIYGITVSTEEKEVIRLIEFIKSNCEDDIVVLIDSNKGTNKMFNKIKKFTDYIYVRPFDNDFSKFKNGLNESCMFYDADFVFQLDADEMVTEKLVKNIKQVLINDASDIDLIYLPRINKVDGITQEHLIKWNWSMDSLGRINFPDFQGRIYRPNLKWVNKIHEKIDANVNKIAYIEHDDYCILHNKTIEKQEHQNNFYHNLSK